MRQLLNHRSHTAAHLLFYFKVLAHFLVYFCFFFSSYTYFIDFCCTYFTHYRRDPPECFSCVTSCCQAWAWFCLQISEVP